MECICERIFSESVIPLLLSCGHTSCSYCVTTIQEENLPCPHCDRPYHCSTPNITLCSQINSISKNKEPFCEICPDKEPHLATVKCFDCGQFLCDSVAQYHRVLNATRRHKLVSISELPTVQEDSVLLCLYPKKCSTHHRPYTHYNESIHGSHLLCVYCATEKAHFLTSHPCLPLSTASLSQQKIQEARAFSPQISDRITSLTSTSQINSDKIQQLDQSRDLALNQIEQTFQTYRQALDAREAELKGRVKELHKSARFEMEEEIERAGLYVGQLQQYAKGLEEMEAALTLANPSTSSSFLSSVSFPVPEGLLVDVCLLEASLRSSFSHSMEVEVSPTEGVEFSMSEEEEGCLKMLSSLGNVPLLSAFSPPVYLPPCPPPPPRPPSPPPSRIDVSGKTLLSASDNGELEVVRALLDRGDDVNQKDKKGNTPLHWASSKGHLSIVSLLLDRGANMNVKTKMNIIPCCPSGHRMLLSDKTKYFCDLCGKHRDKTRWWCQECNYDVCLGCYSLDGYTPLHIASEKGHLPIVSLLLDRGANINEKNHDGVSVLYIASSKGHIPIVSLLLDRGANIHEKNKHGFTALLIASINDHLPMVSFLLERGANINGKDNDGCTVLHIASSRGKLSIVSLLLDRGANIHEKDNGGVTSLHFACRYGHLPIATLLIDRGAYINEKEDDGSTALFIACCKGHHLVVSLLLDRGANINEKDNDGYTPLHIVSQLGHLPIVSLLLDRGANINEKNKSGMTPLKLAQEIDNIEVSEFLKSKGARQWILW